MESDASRDADLSYEEALLDAQLRSFFRAEYGSEDVPPGQFDKVISAIEGRPVGDVTQRSRTVPSVASLFVVAARKLLAGPVLSRVVPGSVALLILAATLGPNMSELLRGNATRSYGTPPPSVVYSPDYPVALRRVEHKLREYTVITPLYNPNFDPPETWAPPEAMEQYVLPVRVNIQEQPAQYQDQQVRYE